MKLRRHDCPVCSQLYAEGIASGFIVPPADVTPSTRGSAAAPPVGGPPIPLPVPPPPPDDPDYPPAADDRAIAIALVLSKQSPTLKLTRGQRAAILQAARS